MTENNRMVIIDHSLFSGESIRKHGGRAVCPRALQCPDNAICYHAIKHWRGTHCNRDRRDNCPTCSPIGSENIKNNKK